MEANKLSFKNIADRISTFSPFKAISKSFLGIDVGTSSVKIIEISSWGERKKLENYGEIMATSIYEEPFRTFDKNTLLFSNKNIARAIMAILEESKTSCRKAIFSIPDFSSFFTNFELPTMTEEELAQAVVFEAKRHVPLPLGEVTLDWQVINENNDKKTNQKSKILLVAVPNEIIGQYKNIAEMAGLELIALEAEVFGLLRSLAQQEKKPVALIDIGAQTSTCSIIEMGTLRTSHSFDLSGNKLTEIVSKSLSIEYAEAEKLKNKYGILNNDGLKEAERTKEIILPLIDIILREIEKVCDDFNDIEGRQVEKIILAGATALLPGLKDYTQDYLKKRTELANPFSDIFYPPILEQKLKRMGPSFAIATGMALRGVSQ
ncbi:MAG: type IV pilus assembly protein PilM [Patescibacteria group bacterium]